MIIAICGFAGAGKDTAGAILGRLPGWERMSFAGPLKDVVAAAFDWPRELLEGDTFESRDFRETPDEFWSVRLGINNFTPRLALQLWGTEVIRGFHPEFWLARLERRMWASSADHIVITDARFKNEFKMLRMMGARLVRVVRPGLGPLSAAAAHASERDHLEETDGVIEVANNGTVADLERKMLAIISS